MLTPDERRAVAPALAPLTLREREVVLAACEGGDNEQIASRLGIAMPTLRTHMMRINHKLGTRGKSDLIRLIAGAVLPAYRNGVVAPDSGPGAREGDGR